MCAIYLIKFDLQIKFANILLFKSKCSLLKIYHLKDEVFTQRFRHSMIRKFCQMVITTTELDLFCELKNQIKSNAIWYHECCDCCEPFIDISLYALMLILRIERSALNVTPIVVVLLDI